MNRVITYTLTLEEPCLLAAPGGDPNTESSLDYIPGGALRGALAAAYLRNGNDAGPTFENLFLSGKARYLNAYPLLDGRTLPAPRAWTKLKDAGEDVYNRAEEEQFKRADEGIPSSVGAAFVTLSEPITRPQVDFEIAVHTARNREKGHSIEGDADSALFRYRALARDQVFSGAIAIDDEIDAAPLEALLNDKQLLLGGSQTAGYGLARITLPLPDEQDDEKENIWREVENQVEDIAAESSFIVYLSSHAILYHPKTGQPTADILPFLPGGSAGYTIDKSFAATTWVGGFNKQRGLPLTQQWALQMGSTWVIKTGKPVTAAEIVELEHTGIGARTEEGFGRLIFAPRWPQQKFQITEKIPSPQPSAVSNDALDVVAHPLLMKMNKRIVRAELDRELAVRVVELAVPGNVRGRLSRSQLGRLQVRIRRVAEDNYNFETFINYLDQTKDRKSADDQFRKYAVAGKNFRDSLRELARQPASVWGLIGAQGGEWPRVGPAAYDFKSDDKLTHEYTVKFIANLCRQLSKLEVKP